MAGAIVVVASGAAAAAAAAHKAACVKLVHGYTHDAATIAESRQYADCINRMYPDAWAPGTVLAAKVLVAAIFIAVIGRFVDTCLGYRVGILGWWEDFIAYPVLWGAGVSVAGLLAAAAVAGARFLVS